MTNKLHSKFHARLTVCLVGFLFLATVQAQQVLQVGRTDVPSPLSDIVQRVIAEALQRCGLSAQYNKMPLLRSIAMTNDGALDADLLRIADAAKQYPNLISVPTPVAVTNVALYGRDAKQVNLPRAEIAKLKVGLTRGTLILTKNSEGMTVIDTQTVGTTFEMLKNNRFDIAMMIHIDAELEIAKNYPDGFARRTSYWATEPVYFHLNKKHQALVPKINAALQEMQKEGLISKYFEEGLQKINIKPLKPAS
jgi:polar amino acid transport system substrate-binding protein